MTTERKNHKRQDRMRLKLVQTIANEVAAENGGKVDTDELERRMTIRLATHPECSLSSAFPTRR
jgi:hypothetical protein